MRRKYAALALCLLLVLQMAIPSARAAESVFFTAVGESVLPLADETMPFWSNSYLYVPSTIFTGTVRDTLDISYIRNTAKKLVILYRGSQSLHFELGKSYAQDTDGYTYYPGAVQKNGVIYVPASVVASFFGLLYTAPQVPKGRMVWLRRDSVLSDKQFADAATSAMDIRYEEYLRAKDQGPAIGGEPAPDPGVVYSGKNLYLCMEAAEAQQVAPLLDALDRYGSQAAFYCTPSFLEEQGDLLRRMTATGQAIGLLADAADETRTVAQQLAAGNAALERATCTRTRLAYIRGGDSLALQETEAAGYRCLSPDLERAAYGLSGTADARTLLGRVNARRGAVSVWLAESVTATGLRAFLAAAADAEDVCLAMTETV